MRDRLSDLHVVRQKPLDSWSEERGGDEEDLQQTAVLFDEEDVMESTFKEARAIRMEIGLLRTNVKNLGKHNTRFLTSMRRISSIKRDTNALGRDIKRRAELTYARLTRLEARSKELEKKHGHTSALARMVRSQYLSLSGAFHDALSEYNDAEVLQRENCKVRIQRQAEIMGQELSCEQIEGMIETGQWTAFSENLLTDGRTGARMALTEIEKRHKELLELEGRIKEVQELFFQMALLVEEQGFMVDNIQANVSATQDHVVKATSHVGQAVKYKKDNPCRKLCCCCCPCC